MQSVDLQIEAMLPRVLLARQFEYKKNMTLSKHRIAHNYEIGFYLAGDGEVFINGKENQIHYGDIRFSVPGTRLNSTPEYKCITITFDFGERGVLYKNQILDSIPEYFATSGELEGLFNEILKCFNSTSVSSRLKLNALIMQLIAELFSAHHSKKTYSEAVRDCIGFIKENYAEKITLEELSELSGYSGPHTMRIFKEETGQTPHEWLTNVRINRAKELLARDTKTLEAIAEECGFASPAHFKILFKKIVGITPGVFRKNAKVY